MKIRDDIELGQHSHVGMARTANEDFFGYWESDDDREFDLKGRLVVVCDGMGGHTGGEIASRMAVKQIIENYQTNHSEDIVENLRLCIEQANAAVFGEGRKQPELKGMGTTVTAVVQRRDIVYFGQVGDSRAYLIRGGAMKQMTKDHSLVQQLVDEGLLDASEMENHPDKNVILRSLGVKAEVDVDVSHVPVVNNDLLLLCSDGLSGLVSDDEMLATVNQGMANGGSLRKICEELVNKANAAGGHDNITVQILRINSTDSATTDTTPPETVTQSFNEDQVQASIAQARAEATARGDAPPAPATPMLATAPSMPVPVIQKPPSKVGGAGMLAGGLAIGLLVGLGLGFALSGGSEKGTEGVPTLVEAAQEHAVEAGAQGTDSFKAAAAKGETLDAVEAYMDAAGEANRQAATLERQRAETLRGRLGNEEGPLLMKALDAMTNGTVALNQKQFSEARAHFAAARALLEAAEGAK